LSINPAARAERFTLAAVGEAVRTNLELTRRAVGLWNAGAVEALVKDVFAPDLVFYGAPEIPDAGVYRGAEDAAIRLRALMEVTGHPV
jgi:hypothetical protein